MSLQVALVLVPLVDPVDHAEQREGRRACGDRTFGLASPLHLGYEVFDKVDVFLFTSIDPAPQSRRQRMVLMQHNGDLAIARAEHYFYVQTD